MSDDKEDALTPVKANEKREMTSEQKEAAKKFGKDSTFPENVREKLLKGENLNFSDMMMGFINEAAGSPFSFPVFGEMAYRQLAPLILEKNHLQELLETAKDPSKMTGKEGETATKLLTDLMMPFSILLRGIKPKDQIEGMLAIQMIGIHYAAMDCLEKAKGSKYLEDHVSYLNSATKLSRTFTAQMEALNRHRGKGQQKMTVEHVHVNAGGQAIIGNVQSGKKNKKGGGSDGGNVKK